MKRNQWSVLAAAVVVSVAAVAVVESAIAGKSLALIETPQESPAQTVLNVLCIGITRRGPEVLSKNGCSDEPATTLKGSYPDWEHYPLLSVDGCRQIVALLVPHAKLLLNHS
jgi:hypothetical protein